MSQNAGHSHDVAPTAPADDPRTSPDLHGGVVHQPYYTDVSLYGSAVVGLIIGIIFYVVLIATAPDSYFGHIFLDRGWVTKLEAALACWASSFILFKWWHLHRQIALSRVQLLPENLSRIENTSHAATVIRYLDKIDPSRQKGILFRRIRQSFVSFRAFPNRNTVAETMSSLASVDLARTENSYSVLRVMIWAIPIIGFIGTVLGLGSAVGGFGASLPNAADFIELKKLLVGVTSGLSVAFDATFAALFISLLLMFPASILEKREQDFLTSIEDFCQHEVLSLFVNDDGSTVKPSEIARVLEAALKQQHDKFIEWWTNANSSVNRIAETRVKGEVR